MVKSMTPGKGTLPGLVLHRCARNTPKLLSIKTIEIANPYIMEHIIILLMGESDENESCRTF